MNLCTYAPPQMYRSRRIRYLGIQFTEIIRIPICAHDLLLFQYCYLPLRLESTHVSEVTSIQKKNNCKLSLFECRWWRAAGFFQQSICLSLLNDHRRCFLFFIPVSAELQLRLNKLMFLVAWNWVEDASSFLYLDFSKPGYDFYMLKDI